MSDPKTPHRRAWRTDDQWVRLRARIEAADLSTRPPAWHRPARWAAAAAIVVAAALGVRHFTATRVPERRIATTAAGERIVLRLADSSVVTLGPASRVTYAIGAGRRDVELEGLAAFDVVHDASRPFAVRAKNGVATDLGTRFVVRAYASDSVVEVAVTEGVVALAGTNAPGIELHAGDVAQVGANGVPLRETRAAQTRAAWVDGRLVFNDEPLANVAAEMSRWFGVEIRLSSVALGKRPVTAVYNNPSLTGVLDALQATLGLRVERTGRTIVITERAR